jgi:uncharacterized OsmC-like protein
MKISASIQNSFNSNKVTVKTNEEGKMLDIPAKSSGYGSSVNGGELLFLSLAACYCNDIYREADKRNIKVNSVEVEVNGEFGAEGEPASNITYSAIVKADASEEVINELIKSTDKLAEIHNTLRKGAEIKLQLQKSK